MNRFQRFKSFFRYASSMFKRLGWFFLIYLILIGAFFMSRYSLVPKTKLLSEHKNKFYSLMDNLIITKDSFTLDISTTKQIFNSLDRESTGELKKYGMINSLEDYFTIQFTDSTKISNQKNKIIKELIGVAQIEEPFSQLKPEEQRILTNLDKAIKLSDKELANFNLTELNDYLRTRNENYVSLENQNRWSIPLAWAGIICTIILGIYPLFKKNNESS